MILIPPKLTSQEVSINGFINIPNRIPSSKLEKIMKIKINKEKIDNMSKN
jgi:hypothetical protein